MNFVKFSEKKGGNRKVKVKIKYNVPIGNFRAVERTETFYAVSKWEVEGTSLIYFKTDRYNIRTVAKSEIVSIEK